LDRTKLPSTQEGRGILSSSSILVSEIHGTQEDAEAWVGVLNCDSFTVNTRVNILRKGRNKHLHYKIY
jgi:hypothetical protein